MKGRRRGPARCRSRRLWSPFPLLSALLLLASMVLAGCDRDSRSPGVIQASLEGPASSYGAAVLEVAGPGVVEVVGAAGTQVWTREVEPERIRFVVIQPSTGPLAFGVRVRDRSGPAPTFTIVELADGEDRVVTPTGSERIRIRR
ncbi:MAG: hypothetical protein EA422_10335 [Gemmatimonadales bacterium]|nr:MAG: hypothetical protein EA422_10335 [Gemmatimonadales bacterium]